ncbi:asparagine synthase-related protein [Aestuariivivens sediminicola]|uniref:asparagine synthase-related protein n=1 Tax=Aestuariivivens sediminicola TaxID=2913560 RepID=UPI001F56DC92|nr:asparagine synthase-related protein [Aestuariivivens sediminicola]
MRTVTTPIIPTHQTFAKVKAPHELHLEAICVFVAIGFFLDQDTYWKDKVVLAPASYHDIDDQGFLICSKPWFRWHSTPSISDFTEALEAYSDLFEDIIAKQSKGKQVILPLSGGLDSRTQAVALHRLKREVFSYSYEFQQGYPETKIARKIAEVCDFEFEGYTIPKGYLWSVLDRLFELNGGYSDFTSPRQMAVVDYLEGKGEVFSLGHWGDVLFDSMQLPSLSEGEQVEVLMSKLLKRGGPELAQSLWQHWGLSGEFMDYFRSRISALLSKINIENTNAKLRTFKSLYWAPRWTTVNLSVFGSLAPITLPFYDDAMCQFICSLPENMLSNRKLQIAYIKHKMPELAKISWQNHRPFHLYNYNLNRVPYNLPYRGLKKIQRIMTTLTGKPYVQRNWELQFLGDANRVHLLKHINGDRFFEFIPKDIVLAYCDTFYKNKALEHAHPINMLLVLSQFYKYQIHG